MEPPKPSNQFLPDWYKKMNFYTNGDKIPFSLKTGTNLTIKSCTPVLDLITAGYMITLDSDVICTDKSEYEHRIMWKSDREVITVHPNNQFKELFIPDEFEKDLAYKWDKEMSWGILTPPGYSLLVSHPFYRFDLPFFTLPAIVDADEMKRPFNLPFLLRKDFNGIIERGTPIAQVIPFKRENWKSEIEKEVDEYAEFNKEDLNSKIFRSYKSRWWHKKTYK